MNFKDFSLTLVVVSSSAYSCYILFVEIKEKLKIYNEKKLFCDRHNCVVMYHKTNIPTGWYPSNEKAKEKVSVDDSVASILYFINTAKKSLDIAMMCSNIKCVHDALCAAQRRGVRVRLIVNYCGSAGIQYQRLKQRGIKVYYYVAGLGSVSSILHYKYMIKDYAEDEGYAYMGSMNWTVAAVYNSYEDTAFLSNSKVVAKVYANFQKLLQHVRKAYKTNEHVKMVLKDC